MNNVVVLNTIQALAADLALVDGLISVTGMPEKIDVERSTFRKKWAYSAGVAPIKDHYVATGGLALTADTIYTLEVRFPDLPDQHAHGYVKRYTWISGTSAPTAANIATGLAAAVNADTARKVNASVVSTTTLRLTSTAVGNGDLWFAINSKGTTAVNTAFVAPSGTPALVRELAAGNGQAVSDSAQYTVYEVHSDKTVKSSGLSGIAKGDTVMVKNYICLSSGATNYAALETALDAVLDGTSTAANYEGVPA